MADALSHRGPDDAGIWTGVAGSPCVLAHRRLSIIDLAGGHQPMTDASGEIAVTFNGEIYNFPELRTELEQAGHVFRTQSDTEVLLHGWRQWGTGLPDRLRGMFAFALWETPTRTLFLARDPLGKKPLVYDYRNGMFRFASELKALLADSALPREIDPQALLLYLNFGYIPHPWTIFKGIRKLPPGHWLILRDGVESIEQYWSPPSRPTFSGTFLEACIEFRRIFTLAVRRRLVADVPLGAFLSGGIDSTVVVGVMNELCPRPVKTFTIGFDEAAFDETNYARAVARRFGTDHHELIVRPDALEVLPTLAHHFDEPFADSSAIPTYYVSRLTRQHVTVALTGDGGDEAFGGYRRYRVGKFLALLDRLPAGRSIAGLAGQLLPSGDRTTSRGRLKRLLQTVRDPIAEAYFAQMTQFAPETLNGLLSAEWKKSVNLDQPREWFASLFQGTGDSPDLAAACMSTDLRSYLPCDILTKVDIASMAVSLECRSPFLDRDVVDFACSLPTAWRLRGLFGHKHLLKHAMSDLLPTQVLNRKKAGFAVPLPAWFRGPLQPMLRDTLLDSTARSRGYFQASAVEKLIAEHTSGQRNHSGPLWALLMLEMWQREWGQ